MVCQHSPGHLCPGVTFDPLAALDTRTPRSSDPLGPLTPWSNRSLFSAGHTRCFTSRRFLVLRATLHSINACPTQNLAPPPPSALLQKEEGRPPNIPPHPPHFCRERREASPTSALQQTIRAHLPTAQPRHRQITLPRPWQAAPLYFYPALGWRRHCISTPPLAGGTTVFLPRPWLAACPKMHFRAHSHLLRRPTPRRPLLDSQRRDERAT